MIAFYRKNIKNRCPIWGQFFISLIVVLNFFMAPVGVANAGTTASHFTVSVTGLYLQPSASNLGYAVYTTPLPAPSPNWYQQTVKPDYKGSFDLGLQYDLADRSNQIDFDWFHFNSNNSASYAVTEPNTSVGPPYYFGPAEQFLLNTAASSYVKFNVDQVNLVFGHSIKLNNSVEIKPVFGLGSAILKEGITNNYSGADPVFGPYTHSAYINSKFTGIGPRLGADGEFFITNHFGIDAAMDGSILLGRLSTNTNFNSWTGYTGGAIPHNNTPTNTTLSSQSQTKVVPEVETKMGLFYNVVRKSGSIFSIHTGYMFSDYVNSIYQVTPSSLVPAAWEGGTVAVISEAQNRSDLSLNGPYLKVSWQFA